eukprot:CAMPEP_0182557858 /NCGR_PEP_ID=MMETSP1324-20130603/1633_1 /TAXON_ID=236786 /ORGANISM="Florenciella sp., Strain RCC1587" /LENGTH=91 /DNA_ID=CAMNT_0024769985 /DNA_START=166 /DNA_END=441 /DNA_ORIENTATION=+
MTAWVPSKGWGGQRKCSYWPMVWQSVAWFWDQSSRRFASRRDETKPTRPRQPLVERDSVGGVLGGAQATAVRSDGQARVRGVNGLGGPPLR